MWGRGCQSPLIQAFPHEVRSEYQLDSYVPYAGISGVSLRLDCRHTWGCPKNGSLFWGSPQYEDCSILWSVFGSLSQTLEPSKKNPSPKPLHPKPQYEPSPTPTLPSFQDSHLLLPTAGLNCKLGLVYPKDPNFRV